VPVTVLLLGVPVVNSSIVDVQQLHPSVVLVVLEVLVVVDVLVDVEVVRDVLVLVDVLVEVVRDVLVLLEVLVLVVVVRDVLVLLEVVVRDVLVLLEVLVVVTGLLVEVVVETLVEVVLEVVVVGRLDEVVELDEVVVTGTEELVLVVGTVLVVVGGGGGVVVVVLPAGTQPPCSHASQQLGNSPTQALPPCGGLQNLPRRLMLHVVLPAASVRQQVTAPALPQVDCAAQPMTTSAHSSRREPSVTAWSVTAATQLT